MRIKSAGGSGYEGLRRQTVDMSNIESNLVARQSESKDSRFPPLPILSSDTLGYFPCHSGPYLRELFNVDYSSSKS